MNIWNNFSGFNNLTNKLIKNSSLIQIFKILNNILVISEYLGLSPYFIHFSKIIYSFIRSSFKVGYTIIIIIQ